MVIILIVYLVIIGFIFFNQKKELITVSTFQVDSGYGYVIKKNNNILIMQKNIPTIKNRQSFCTEIDAQKTANLVKSKILKRLSPSISLEELKELRINFNCLKPRR